ncbi:O-antigen ligase family protein [Candidatus Uhrbacteria bacterium]|nr:O-antigen ligase family protein [Candidatus Uhrbacteria bacterium]
MGSRMILWFLILGLPLYQLRWSFFGIPTTGLEMIILLCAGIFIDIQDGKTFLQRLRHFFTIEDQMLRWAAIGFFAATTIALIAHPTPGAAGIWKAYVVDAMIAGLTVYRVARLNSDALQTVASAAAALLTVIGGIAVLQWFFPSGVPIAGAIIFPISDPDWSSRTLFRAVSVFPYPNAVGLLAAPLVALIIGSILQVGRKPLLMTGLMAGLLSITLANSNGAMLAVIVALLVIAIVTRLSKSQRLWLIALGLVFWVLLPFVPWGSVAQPIVRTNPSFLLRLEQHNETRALIAGSPLFGGGLANYQFAIAPYHNTEVSGPSLLYPHNLVLALWTELGFFGLVAFLILILLTLRHLAERQQHTELALFGVLVAILVHGIVDVPYFKNDLSVLFWGLWGLSWGLQSQKACPQAVGSAPPL